MKKLLIFFWIVTTYVVSAQETLTVMNYNVLNYAENGANESTRNPLYIEIFNFYKPDIVVLQEIHNLTAYTRIDDEVVKKLDLPYKVAPFNDGPATDNVCFYRIDKLTYLNQYIIKTNLRDINAYVFRDNKTLQIFTVMGMHLKAGTTSSDELNRQSTCLTLRNWVDTLPANFPFILAGDFNTFSADEPGYKALTDIIPGRNLRFIDPIKPIGNFGVSFYDKYHSHSATRMDERLDFFLFDSRIERANSTADFRYLNNSYRVCGNPGLFYQRSVTTTNNPAENNSIRTALSQASDHLPVMHQYILNPYHAPARVRNFNYDINSREIQWTIGLESDIKFYHVMKQCNGEAKEEISSTGAFNRFWSNHTYRYQLKETDLTENCIYTIEAELFDGRRLPMGISLNNGVASLKYTKTINQTYKIYPNPTQGSFTIEGSFDKAELYSSNGKLVEVISSQSKQGGSNLKSGIYLLKIEANNQISIQKLIVR